MWLCLYLCLCVCAYEPSMDRKHSYVRVRNIYTYINTSLSACLWPTQQFYATTISMWYIKVSPEPTATVAQQQVNYTPENITHNSLIRVLFWSFIHSHFSSSSSLLFCRFVSSLLSSSERKATKQYLKRTAENCLPPKWSVNVSVFVFACNMYVVCMFDACLWEGFLEAYQRKCMPMHETHAVFSFYGVPVHGAFSAGSTRRPNISRCFMAIEWSMATVRSVFVETENP